MLDIIIPTYNNKKGLITTLNSIPQMEEIQITVVDDKSNLEINYNDILSKCHLLYSSNNGGPGNARQYGMLYTNKPYIMFIDTGDYFFEHVFDEVLKTIKENPNENVISWQEISEKNGKICANTHNRVHGRVYKRSFLEQYKIVFCPESSFANEDVGFNRACRLLTEFKFINKPIYMWTYDENSLTKKNNGTWAYERQNIGLALNAIHVYEMCKKLVSPEAMATECGEIMGALHHGVIQTAQERPQYLQCAWTGARLFYEQVYAKNNYGITNSLYQTFSKTLREAREKRNEWTKPIPLNIQRFLNDLESYSIAPSWYNK